jgi:hypothetical protein
MPLCIFGEYFMKMNYLVYLLLMFVLTTCIVDTNTENDTNIESDTNTESYLFRKEFWGEWVDLRNDELIYYIDNQTILIIADGFTLVSYPNPNWKNHTVFLEKQSQNILKMNDKYTYQDIQYDSEVLLIASRIANGSFNGRLVENIESRMATGVRAVSGLGSIDVIVSNLNNSADNQKTKTDSNGNFTVQDIIPGDEYEINVENITVPIATNYIDDDIGNITIKDGRNLKASVSVSDNKIRKLYANTSYSIDIILSEINYNPSAYYADYQIILPEGVTSSSRLSGTADFTYLSDDRIPIKITCDSINGEWEHKKISIAILSEYWTFEQDGITYKVTLDTETIEDSVSLIFYRDKATFYFYSQAPLSGTITNSKIGIMPIGLYSYDYTKSCYFEAIDVPKCFGEDYLIVLYEPRSIIFGIDQDPNPVYADFWAGSSDVAYNSEQNAKSISPTGVVKSDNSGDRIYIFYKLRF